MNARSYDGGRREASLFANKFGEERRYICPSSRYLAVSTRGENAATMPARYARQSAKGAPRESQAAVWSASVQLSQHLVVALLAG